MLATVIFLPNRCSIPMAACMFTGAVRLGAMEYVVGAASLAASEPAEMRLAGSGVFDHILLLVDAILANGLQDIGRLKAVKEPAVAAADHRLCRLVPPPTAQANEKRGPKSA